LTLTASLPRPCKNISTTVTNRLLRKSLSKGSRPKALFKQISADGVTVGLDIIEGGSADVDDFRPVADDVLNRLG